MKKVLLTCAAAGLLIAGSAASAAAVCPAPMFHPWYLGLGLNHYTGMKETWQNDAATLSKLDSSKWGWQVFGGYNVNCNFGTELGIVDFGKNTWVMLTKPATSTGKQTMNGWIAYLDGMYYVPVFKYFRAFAKGGVDYMNTKFKAYAANLTTITDDKALNTFGMNFGFGAEFVYNQFVIRAAYTDYQSVTFGQKNNIISHPTTTTAATTSMVSIPNLLSVDVLYNFG